MSIPRFLILFLIFCLSADFLCAGSEKLPEVNAFFKKMENVTTLSCHFSQEQQIAGLKQPIRLHGRFYMTGQGDLAWIVRAPVRFYCIIRKGRLTTWDGETAARREIDLKEHPAFSTMIGMMKDFFAGRIKVDRDYKCTLVSAVKIKLIPLKHSPLAGNVAQIEITLSPDRRHISVVRISGCNGDRNTMHFKNVVLDASIPESVWKNGEPQ